MFLFCDDCVIHTDVAEWVLDKCALVAAGVRKSVSLPDSENVDGDEDALPDTAEIVFTSHALAVVHSPHAAFRHVDVQSR